MSVISSQFSASSITNGIPIAVSPTGNIYLGGDGGTTNICVFNSTGTQVATVTCPNRHFGFCADYTNNKIYCAGVSCFGIINLSNNTYSSYSSAWLNGVAVGSDGYVYATTNSGYKIQKINPADGTQTNIFTSSGGNILSDAYGVFGNCAIDNDGYIYCITRGSGYIYKFNTSGTLLGLFSSVNSAYGNTFGLTYDSNNNVFYASTTGSTGSLYTIKQDGSSSLYTTFSGPSYGTFYDKFTSKIYSSVIGNNVYLINPLVLSSYITIPSALSYNSTFQLVFSSFNFVLNKTYVLKYGSTVLDTETYTGTLINSTPTVTFNVTITDSLYATLQIYDLSGNTFGNPINLTLTYPCFLQGSKILRLDPEIDEEEYVAVETLRRGDLIKTATCGYKAVVFIGKTTLYRPADDPNKKNRLYRFQDGRKRHPPLYITGEHCLLYKEKDISEAKRREVREHMGDDYITEVYHRVPACLDEKGEPYIGEGPVTIWHFALEHNNLYNNYAVWANGILVETCSIDFLLKKSNMELI